MRGKIFFFVTLCMIALLAGQAYHTFWVREKSPTVYAEMAPVDWHPNLAGQKMIGANIIECLKRDSKILKK